MIFSLISVIYANLSRALEDPVFFGMLWFSLVDDTDAIMLFTLTDQKSRQFGEFPATVFTLRTSNTGSIAVTHIGAHQGSRERGAIVMTAGMFSNRRFWLSDKGIGIAGYLATRGFDCWMFERRGHGASPITAYDDQSLRATIEDDLPAVQAFIASRGCPSALYMGHSFGGVMHSMSLARGFLNAKGVDGLINFSSQLTVGKTFLNKPYSAVLYAITGLLGYFPSRALKMGPENESKKTMRECCELVEYAKGAQQHEFWQDMTNITCPVLGFGSAGDTVDPSEGCQALIDGMSSEHKTFIHLSTANGHRQNYDHVGMLVSKTAQEEVWPMVDDWLMRHRELEDQ